MDIARCGPGAAPREKIALELPANGVAGGRATLAPRGTADHASLVARTLTEHWKPLARPIHGG
eukprot:11163768-Lingulodinium_polyedra.AAC.1